MGDGEKKREAKIEIKGDERGRRERRRREKREGTEVKAKEAGSAKEKGECAGPFFFHW